MSATAARLGTGVADQGDRVLEAAWGGEIAGALLLLGLGVLVSLDERVLGRRAFTQPIVAGSLGGACLGDPATGLILGLLLQMLWPAPIWAGGHVPPAGGLAALAAVGFLTMASPTPPAPFLLAVLGFGSGGPGSTALVHTAALWWAALGLAFAVAALGARWERGLRAGNQALETSLIAALGRGGPVAADGPASDLDGPFAIAWRRAALRGAALVASGWGLGAAARASGFASGPGPGPAGAPGSITATSLPALAAGATTSSGFDVASVLVLALVWMPVTFLAAGLPQSLGRLGASRGAARLQWIAGAVGGGLLMWGWSTR